MKERVVITGMGALTPVGNDVESTFNNLVNGVNGIDFIKSFDTSKIKVKVAGEIKNINLEDFIDRRTLRRSDRVMSLGLVSAIQAYEDSGLTESDYNPFRFGLYMTSGIGGIQTIEEESKKLNNDGPDRISPFFIPNSIINMTSGLIGIHYKLKGPSVPIVTACSSATNAIGEAYRAIKDGYIDLAFAGGSEAAVNLTAISAFSSLRALSTSSNPNRASIPFDQERGGFVMGEGSGVLVVESLTSAKKRGAKIYAEITGYGNTSDGYHITSPDPEATGMIEAINQSLRDAGLDASEIDYINAHGTSTELNDKTETYAIKQVFGDHAYNVNISSTKSMTGHLLGATGAIESIVCVKSILEGVIPPTINLEVKDSLCDLNYTPGKAVRKNVDNTLNINLGFGGQNASLVIGRYKE